MRGSKFDRLSHGVCSRHEARHTPRLRLAPPCSHPRSQVAVAELGCVRRRYVHSMTTGKWLPWTTAVFAHAAVACVIIFWPRTPQVVTPPDFIAEEELVTSELFPDLPEPPELRKPLGPFGPNVCSVHNVQMTVAEVPIVYGLLLEFSSPSPYRAAATAAREAQFPHSERWSWGGCCVTVDRTTRIYICTECERAEKQWKLAQQQPK